MASTAPYRGRDAGSQKYLKEHPSVSKGTMNISCWMGAAVSTRNGEITETAMRHLSWKSAAYACFAQGTTSNDRPDAFENDHHQWGLGQTNCTSVDIVRVFSSQPCLYGRAKCLGATACVLRSFAFGNPQIVAFWLQTSRFASTDLRGLPRICDRTSAFFQMA